MSLASATRVDECGDTAPLRWVVLGLAALTVFSSYYEEDALGPIADLLVRQRHLSQFQIGDLTAVISLPNIPLAVFNGLLIDRYGPVRVTLWAALLPMRLTGAWTVNPRRSESAERRSMPRSPHR